MAEKKKLRALADDLEEKLASKDQERSDAVEHLMKENQKFKDLAEDEKKKLVIDYNKQLSVKDNEISNMERELKNMLKVQKQLSLKDNEVSNMERELKNMLKVRTTLVIREIGEYIFHIGTITYPVYFVIFFALYALLFIG